MSQLQRKAMTPEEFLAWEAGQELRWEFDGFEPVAMTGDTDAHAAIQANVIIALGSRLRGKPCHVRGSEIKVRTGPGYRYPGRFRVLHAGRPRRHGGCRSRGDLRGDV